MIKGKHILIGAGIAALISGGAYLLNLSRLSRELQVVIKASLYKLSLSGAVIRINVTLKNPTSGKMTVKHPFVKIQYKGTTLASSDIKDTDYDLLKYSQKDLEPIDINLSFLTLATSAPALLKAYRTEGTLPITIVTVTTIDNRIPYTKTETITLGSKQG